MSLFEDTYLTIEEPSEGIFRDKGSKFIAYAYPFKNEKDLKDIIADLKALHPKARHHCWAYRLTTDRGVFRINDDGEPSGTAGRPILNVLLSKDLTNILVVVVRYFGGTLLGVPGLINAYKTATLEALDVAKIEERTVNDVYDVRFDYLQMNDVMRVMKEEGIQMLDQQFDNSCVITMEIRKMQVNQVLAKLDKIEKVTHNYLYTL
ncbi:MULTISPECIES: IMPACT family protein [Sphingobacterium]|uniref:Thymidylate synthase n=2 Tax=Sphingobacterium TaxID=28453 RepID=U2HDZ5_9SPHI|nr:MULTISPECIES: YigZ family protein [Sphingobacterium]ERJ59986.1 thymidylate synthase [Sphingobacterium paucimobilis HER1398]MBL1408796.1 YigZ family protein [Sphingobacterium faecale]